MPPQVSTLFALLFIVSALASSPYSSLKHKSIQKNLGAILSFRGGGDDDLRELVEEMIESNRKVVVVTGGVLSGIGKGVTASSIGVLLRGMGFCVTALKIDPYLNVDAGTMSPFEHGEVFVLDDGGETDLDLGNYERFLGVSLTRESNLSTGKIYQNVIERERMGDYLGKTVQVVPHISDAIQRWILTVAKAPVKILRDNDASISEKEIPEICIVELGGTLGDIESMPFVEALRQLQEKVGYKNMCFVHVSLIPVLGSPTEQKTKPTQHSVAQMRQLGLTPDFIACRGVEPLKPPAKSKISMFTSVPENAIISLHDVSNIYRVPLMMMDQSMASMLAKRLRLKPFSTKTDSREYSEVDETYCASIRDTSLMKEWTALANSADEPSSECRIAMVGKYVDQGDAYLSVLKALTHSALATKQSLKLEWIVASNLDENDTEATPALRNEAWKKLRRCHGIVVPGGFGSRGFEGKIAAIKYARESKKPFLGICLGMQAAVIEYCRNILARPNANSSEFKEDLKEDVDNVVIFMPEGDRERLGGTMRLGLRETVLKHSIARKAYGLEKVLERHRHRYEVNPSLVSDLEAAGLHFVGRNTDGSGERMEVVELSEEIHPYFVATQFHPEFTSRPGKPNKLFLGLLNAGKALAATEKSQNKITMN